MLEKDYIMRMIAQLSQVLNRILFAKQAEQFDEAEHLIENGYEELLGLKGKLIATFDAPTLAGLLGHPEKIKVLAHLLVEDAEVSIAKQQHQEARSQLQKAQALFEHILPLMPSAQEEIKAAITRISNMLDSV